MPDTIRTIQGRVAYFTTGPVINRDVNGRLVPQVGFVEPTFPRGVQRIPVEILGPTGAVLANTITNDTGDYAVQINFGPNPATQVRVRVQARIQLPFGTIVRVLRDAAATTPYTHTSALGGIPANDTMQVDLNIALNDSAAAYAILDALYDAFITAKSGINATLPNVDVYWAPGNGAASVFTPQVDFATLLIAGGVNGNPASNQDEWDHGVIVRLLGEYLLHYFFGNPPPQGANTNGGLLVPSVAWREGFLDYWSCLGRGNSEFFDTVGIGAQGRVVRFFNIESFFDATLPPVGPDDPNVYQSAAESGIGSRFTVAEMLWDITDTGLTGQDDPLNFPVFLAIQKLRNIGVGRLPYLGTFLDRLTQDGSLDAVTINLLTLNPEDQGFRYPTSVASETVWPRPFLQGGQLGQPLVPPVDLTLSGNVDNSVNPELGLGSLRYFSINVPAGGTLQGTLTTAGNLKLELFDNGHNLITTGTTSVIHIVENQAIFYFRVSSNGGTVNADFDLRVTFN